MDARPRSVTVTRVWVACLAALWLAFGVLIAAGVHPALPASPLVRTAMAGLALLVAGLLLLLAVGLGRWARRAYLPGLGLLLALVLVNFLDDFGWVDLAALLAPLVPLALLIKDRSWYRRPGTGRLPRSPEA